MSRPRTHFKSSRVAVSALAVELGAGAPPSEVRMVPAGPFRAVDGRPGEGLTWELSPARAAVLVAAAAARTSDRVVDYEHQTLNARVNGQPAPAAGWFKTLEWRPDGLWATDLRWTDAAARMIESGEYRYISPVFSWDKKTGAVLDLAMAALVNSPGLDGLTDLSALAALLTDPPAEENPMDELLEQLRWLLNLPVGATADDIKAQLQKLMDQLGGQAAASFDLIRFLSDRNAEVAALKVAAPDPAQYVPIATHQAVSTELADLKATAHEAQVATVVTEALAAGKLLPAQETWAKDLGKANLDSLKAFVESAQATVVPGATQTAGKPPVGNVDLNDPHAIRQAALKYQSEQRAIGNEVSYVVSVAHVTAPV